MGFKKLSEFPISKNCQLCLTSIIDPDVLGEVYQINDVIVHYFCLLLSSHLEQNGTDNQGLLGFFVKDIKKELTRGSRVKCSYCNKTGATVECAQYRCRAVFHVPCGAQNGALNHFFGSFRSFCIKHRPKDITPLRIRELKDLECIFCYSPVLPETQPYIWPLCCRPDTLFHKKCIQRMASSSGYYLKCALCNDKSDFCKGLRQDGIYIPEQEASWEQAPNAYQELAAVTAKCDADICGCPKGREHASKINDSRWALEVCKFCGSTAMHQGCMVTPCLPDMFECDTCSGNNTARQEQIAVSVPAEGVVNIENGNGEQPRSVTKPPYNEMLRHHPTCEHYFRLCASDESCDGSCDEAEKDDQVVLISSDDEAVQITSNPVVRPNNSRNRYFRRQRTRFPSQGPHQSALVNTAGGPAQEEIINIDDEESIDLRIEGICTIDPATFNSCNESESSNTLPPVENALPNNDRAVEQEEFDTVVIDDSDASSVLGDEKEFALDKIPPDKFLLSCHFSIAKGYYEQAALPPKKVKKRRKTKRLLNSKKRKKVW